MSQGEQPRRVHVTAALLVHDGKVLAARRRHGHLAGRWEFPGGKVEPGETPEACLAREIREELGAEVTVERFLARSDHSYPHLEIRLDGFLCTWRDGELLPGRDHSAVTWVTPAALNDLDLAPADVPLARALQAALAAGSGT